MRGANGYLELRRSLVRWQALFGNQYEMKWNEGARDPIACSLR